MDIKLYNRLNEALTSFNFDDDDEITFTKSSKHELSTDLVRQFIYKRIVNEFIGPLDDVEEATVESWKHSTSTAYDNMIKVESLSDLKIYMARAHAFLGDNGNYNWLDVSSLKSLTELFGHDVKYTKFNGDITKWNISNVVNMNYTFTGLYNFDLDLSKWDFSNVKYMSGCFSGCNDEFKDHIKSLIDFSKIKTKFNIF